MTQNQIYASALRDIALIVEFNEADVPAMSDLLVHIRNMADRALVDGTAAHQNAAYLRLGTTWLPSESEHWRFR